MPSKRTARPRVTAASAAAGAGAPTVTSTTMTTHAVPPSSTQPQQQRQRQAAVANATHATRPGGAPADTGKATTAATAATSTNSWSSTQQGGSVLQWLSQKTQTSSSSHDASSRGAIEYLLHSSHAATAAAAAAAARASAVDTTSSATAVTGDKASAVPRTQHVDAAMGVHDSGNNSSGGGGVLLSALLSSTAAAPAAAPVAASSAAAPHVSGHVNEDDKEATVRRLTALLTGRVPYVEGGEAKDDVLARGGVDGDAAAAAAAATSAMMMTAPPPLPREGGGAAAVIMDGGGVEQAQQQLQQQQMQQYGHTDLLPPPPLPPPPPQQQQQLQQLQQQPVGAPRGGLRGRRRRDGDRHAQLQQRLAQQAEEARKKHEEAMRTDPEYQQRYRSYQERQAAAQTAQAQLFAQYNLQEHLLVHHVVTERLDVPMILELIDQHDVVFICTDTGSGKSTNVPRALLELSPHTRVVSTQPRRTATVSIATRVAALRREKVGEDVGYWIRGEKQGDEQTRLWYMTSYTLLLRLLEAAGDALPFTHIVLDEFHERQPDLEVTVALLRLALRHRTAAFKLILMSATLNTEDWEGYFAGLRVATYKQSEPPHPIHDYFLEDTCTLLGLDYAAPANLVQRGVVSKETLEQHLYIAQSLILFLNSFSHPHHAILVFLPGRAQVEALQSWALSPQLAARVDVVAWHSAVDLSEVEAAMRRQLPQRQKLYLATDIAEVSITLPDVVYVVDLVLVKRPRIAREAPASMLYPPLVTQWISKGSVAQRRGRIGRVQQGFYFCLFPAAQVDALADYAQPPIEHSRIDELALHCLQVVSNPVAIFSLCHGQPLASTIASAMNTLTELGCIVPLTTTTNSGGDAHDSSGSGDGGVTTTVTAVAAAAERVPELTAARSSHWGALVLSAARAVVPATIAEYECTFIGRILQLIPVSPQQGMLVFFGLLTGLESLLILAAAVTSSLSPFTIAGQEAGSRRRYNVARAMEDTENVMRDLCCGVRSDVVAVMKATLLFRVEAARGQGADGGNAMTMTTMTTGAASATAHTQHVRQWCMQKHLSYDKLLAIVDLEQHIKYELANFVPFRDVEDAGKLLEQLDSLAAMVVVMTNVAFVAQSLEVTSESNLYTKSHEAALGVFSDLTAVPDIHSPSCLRWQEGDIILPVQLNLFYDKLLASFSTAVASPRQYWMSLLLFSHRVCYAAYSDDDGAFYVFALTYCGKQRYVELDAVAGVAVLQFRRQLSHICASLRLQHAHKHSDADELEAQLRQHGLRPLQEAQREVVAVLVSIFRSLDSMTVDEVEHDEEDLDAVSTLSFALPTRVNA